MYEGFNTRETNSASCRFVRPTAYRVINNANELKNIGVPLGLVIRPLADQSEMDDPVPCIDYTSAPLIRCGRCQSFMNPFYEMRGSTYICNLCGMNNNNIGGLNQVSSNEDSQYGVYDLLVPEAFNIKPIVKPRILFCVELSKRTIEIYSMILSHIESNIDSIDYPARVGILVYSQSAKFFSFVGKGKNVELKVTEIVDINDPFCALNEGELFMSIADERDKISKVFEALYSLEQSFPTSLGADFEANIGVALRIVLDSMKIIGGRAMVFGTTIPQSGQFGVPSTVNYDDGASKDKYSVNVPTESNFIE